MREGAWDCSAAAALALALSLRPWGWGWNWGWNWGWGWEPSRVAGGRQRSWPGRVGLAMVVVHVDVDDPLGHGDVLRLGHHHAAAESWSQAPPPSPPMAFPSTWGFWEQNLHLTSSFDKENKILQ